MDLGRKTARGAENRHRNDPSTKKQPIFPMIDYLFYAGILFMAGYMYLVFWGN
jgi:hypothetical protein